MSFLDLPGLQHFYNKYIKKINQDISALNTELGGKANTGHKHTVADVSDLSNASVKNAESVPWSGVSGKPSNFPPAAHKHTADDVTGLTPSMVVYSNANGVLAASSNVTSKDLGCLYGIESNIQTQLNAKLASSRVKGYSWTTEVNGTSIDVNFSQVGLTNGANYAIFVNNANRNAANITVLGISINQAKTQFRIYWDQSFTGNVQFNLMAIQF